MCKHVMFPRCVGKLEYVRSADWMLCVGSIASNTVPYEILLNLYYKM